MLAESINWVLFSDTNWHRWCVVLNKMSILTRNYANCWDCSDCLMVSIVKVWKYKKLLCANAVGIRNSLSCFQCTKLLYTEPFNNECTIPETQNFSTRGIHFCKVNFQLFLRYSVSNVNLFTSFFTIPIYIIRIL